MTVMRRVLLFFVLTLLSVPPAFAQSGANVLLVVNEASPDSERIAAHYARVRSVPLRGVRGPRANVHRTRAAYATLEDQRWKLTDTPPE